MIIYEIITQLIIFLSRLRYWYLKKFGGIHAFTIRKDKDEINLIRNHNFDHEGFYLACCDCDLTHNLFLDKQDKSILHCIPQRPRDYKYKLRKFSKY